MLLFPLVFISSFLISIKEIIKGKKQAVLLFLIFGLPIYITVNSILFKFGFGYLISFLQPLKELIIIIPLIFSLYYLKQKIKLQIIDYALIFFLVYTIFYALLPLGDQNFVNRLLGLKSISFFVLVYFLGRLIMFENVFLSKYFFYIMLLSFGAGLLVLFEVLQNTHFQTFTNYGDYNLYFFNNEPSGNYGLSWTFESAGGFKRFASFFANPLEHAAATIITISVIAAYYTNDEYKFRIDSFGVLVLVMTLASIFFSVSRSSFVSYFLVIYCYGWLTNKKYIIKIFHYLIALGGLYIIYNIYRRVDEDGSYKVILSTLNFTDASSVGHVLEWVQGITSMYINPLGIGLGSSGRVGGSLGENVGGENQFIIIGVQVGIVGLILYAFIYVKLALQAKYWYYRLNGMEKKLCLLILLLKIGLIIPLLTSEVEGSVYISYITWFLAGLFVEMISRKIILDESRN